MVDKSPNITLAPTEYDCPVCMSLMVEPLSIKCTHVICLSCLEKISLEQKPKCPMCRSEFDFSKDLSFNPEVYRKALIENSKDFMRIAEKLLEERTKNSGMVECLISFGNRHKVLQIENSDNRHEWTAFLKLRSGNNQLKSIMDKFKVKANLGNFFEKYHQTYLNQDDLPIEIDESKVIKQVTFFLHPTFTPNKIIKKNPPYEISRIGWGTFIIPIKVEFHDKLGIEPLEVEFNLSFNRSLTEHYHNLYIDIKRLL